MFMPREMIVSSRYLPAGMRLLINGKPASVHDHVWPTDRVEVVPIKDEKIVEIEIPYEEGEPMMDKPAILSLIADLEGPEISMDGEPGVPYRWGLCAADLADFHEQGYDVETLTKEQAIEVYEHEYWRPIFDACPFPFDMFFFDSHFNGGGEAMIKDLQREFGITVDGIIGKRETLPKIVAYLVVNGVEESARWLTTLRIEYHANRAKNKPETHQQYLHGWIRRRDLILYREAIKL